MKKASKKKASQPGKRDLSAELKEGVVALTEARQGKRTLHAHEVTVFGKKLLSKARLRRA